MYLYVYGCMKKYRIEYVLGIGIEIGIGMGIEIGIGYSNRIENTYKE